MMLGVDEEKLKAQQERDDAVFNIKKPMLSSLPKTAMLVKTLQKIHESMQSSQTTIYRDSECDATLQGLRIQLVIAAMDAVDALRDELSKQLSVMTELKKFYIDAR